ncbi:MAG TPA: hypothetical protein PKW61_06520, partial [Tenuifilaceae bacterium]|nr:hypothetical protein [Tenuifilaceae bacterium]
PISIIVNKLLKINELTLGAVIGIMQENEVIVLTKEESKVLDGSVNNIYPLDGFTKNGAGMQKKGTRLERLNKLYEFGTEIHKNTINNTLG